MPASQSTLGGMVEMVGAAVGTAIAEAAQLLFDFNAEYDMPSPPVAEVTERLAHLIEGDHVVILVVREPESQAAVGVAMLRLYPSLWSSAQEAYLAELYVVPSHRGQGFGRALITDVLAMARDRGADYVFLVTSEEDTLAHRLYAAAGFRRTEGADGPAMLAFEREL